MRNDITRDMVEIGLHTGSVEIKENEDGELVCYIGGSWFYFDTQSADTAGAILDSLSEENAIDDMEYCYYYLTISE